MVIFRYVGLLLLFCLSPAVADDTEIYDLSGCVVDEKFRFIFIVDNSGSMSTIEFEQSKETIDATISEVLSSGLEDIQVAVVQYGTLRNSTTVEHTYDVSVSFTNEATVATEWSRAYGTGGDVEQTYIQDHQPASLAKMRLDNVYDPGGLLDITDGTNVQFVFFTDAWRDADWCCSSIVADNTLHISGTKVAGDVGGAVKPGYGEYDALKNGEVLSGIEAQFTLLHVPPAGAPSDEAQAAGAAIASYSENGPYNGIIDSNPTDPDGSGTLPRRYIVGTLSSTDTDAIVALIRNVADELQGTATIAAPTISVSAFNESRHRDELYYSFFQPGAEPSWFGNVKKYRLLDGQVVDKNNTPLLDEFGVVSATSQSFWAISSDGAQVKDGGLAALQPEARNWFTDTGSADADGDIAPIQVTESSQVEPVWVNAGSENERNNIVAFVRGADVLDQNKNSITEEPNHYVADSLHGSPVLLSYWASAATDSTLAEANEVIFAANNMGVLHAVDAATGAEKWSYTPQELLPNIKQYMDNNSENHIYGLDGAMVLHTTRKETTSYDYEVDDAYLYLTQRRGGRGIFALDVSNGHQTTDPFSIMWKIDANVDTDFSDLGQTWAAPQVIPVRYGCPDNCEIKDVLMFGGGYNPLYDDKSLTYPVEPSATGHGNAVYIVDLETGELLWSVGDGAHHTLNLPIKDSVPETPVPVDTDADGVVNVLFFSDIAGHVWRIDLDKNAADADHLAISGGLIASLAPVVGGVQQPLRFFNRVDVVINGITFGTATFNLVLGSGMRSSPLYDEPALNRIYSVRDSWVFTNPVGDELDASGASIAEYRYVKNEINDTRDVITPAALIEYVESDEDSIAPVDNAEYFGFYKLLTGRAEKILQPTLTHSSRIFMTSYVPPDPDIDDSSCAYQLGESRLQILDLKYGTDLVPTAFSPYVSVGSGIVANGTIIDTGDENGPDFIMGINSKKLIDLLEPDNPNIFRRFFRTGWSELDE